MHNRGTIGPVHLPCQHFSGQIRIFSQFEALSSKNRRKHPWKIQPDFEFIAWSLQWGI